MKLFFKSKRKKAKALKLEQLKKNILDYYLARKTLNPEEEKVIEYLQKNGIHVFPYRFKDKYNPKKIKIYKDKKVNLYYIIFENKKLYYYKLKKIKKVQKYFNTLFIEQDIDSPHRYLTQNFNVKPHNIIADVGAAEGNFSLSVVEKAKELYLFEPHPQWVQALRSTFQPWKEKVHIIQKFVSNKNDANNVSLDDFFQNKTINFLKIDTEGSEDQVLDGCKNILSKQKQIKVALCAYHQQNDEIHFSKKLRQYGFSVINSDGYMIFYDDKNLREPYLRRGILRATK
jgi:hypothetical protein